MNSFCFILSILLVLGGHIFKIMRWEQLYSCYEKPTRTHLFLSLGWGYAVNFILPLRIGDFIRAISISKKTKNGLSLAFATIIWDRYFDFLVVGFILLSVNFLNISNIINSGDLMFYIFGSVFLLIFSVVAIRYSKYPKIIMKKISSIFNPKIELTILTFFWAVISSFKNIIQKTNKSLLLLNSLAMWACYIASYKLLAVYLTGVGNTTTFTDIFLTLFSQENLVSSFVSVLRNIHIAFSESSVVLILYTVLTICGLFVISIGLRVRGKNSVRIAREKITDILPQISEKDRLQFLQAYFSDEQKDFLTSYIEMNRDIRIIEDYSAGSNATTMLCMDTEGTFFRKYAYGKDKDKLSEQISWLETHKSSLQITDILRKMVETDYTCYDMEYRPNAVGLFQYIHSTKTENAWFVLHAALEEVRTKLHRMNVSPAEPQLLHEYIEGKVTKNLIKIKNASQIKPLLQYDELMINGKTYKNLPFFEKYLSEESLQQIFGQDIYSDVHGDLTIENIVVLQNNDGRDDFYLIDPNTGNIHDSPAIDWGKLLQSLHGGYEFLMKTSSVKVQDNRIKYLGSRSVAYDKIFALYYDYLREHFSKAEVKSIFYHEIVHWLRLMPYKIEKNKQRALLFYAGMVIVMNDTYERFELGDSI
ncbi:lysylphosphatidylglycerol synthase transmembrane domain-containing protein [Sedimentibacter sp.]|uniref:lysylphosphatidylglycerol synthase transmembrane domain-containing protein n=1 Tax=Sedimentibacter sp. TaxID=1960295 RepID=UPI00289B6E40|nr:lysylphosphatidylglycerol synthase transmembrane domain-containing protein [Sedimentibacter sp.]